MKISKKINWCINRQKIDKKIQIRSAGFRLKFSGGKSISVIKMPKMLLAHHVQGRLDIIKIIKSIKDALRLNCRVKLDFCGTNKIHPGGMLIFLSHIERLQYSYPFKIKARCVSGSLAAQLLVHFGFHGLLGVPVSRNIPKDNSVLRWRYLSGINADGAAVSEMLGSYKKMASHDLPEGLYEALTEALTNVRHHAYPEEIKLNDMDRKWWIFASCDNPDEYILDREKRLYIAVYDMGIGIQVSMRKKMDIFEKGVNKLAAIPLTRAPLEAHLEVTLLRSAVERERSSTGLSYRGKGLPEMRDFVMNTQTGSMHIVSGRAQYAYEASTSTSDCIPCNDALPGTLILWTIPLSSKEFYDVR